MLKNYVREAECANRRHMIEEAYAKTKVNNDEEDIKSIIASLKSGKNITGVIKDTEYIPTLKLKVDKRWSESIRWEFYTLRNSLNMHIYNASKEHFFAEDKAKSFSESFIEKKGLGCLFIPDCRIKS